MVLLQPQEFAPKKPGRQFPGIGTGTVIIKDGHLLLLKRAGALGAGTWAIPGGWLDKGETPHEGAAREVLEEVGCKVKIYSDLFWTNEIFEDDGIHSVTLLMAGMITEGEPRIMEPEKCTEIRWVPVDDVEKLNLFKPLEEAWYQIWMEMHRIAYGGYGKHILNGYLGDV